MAAATLSEKQIQQSMPTSEDDAEYEEDFDQDVDMGANAEAFAANKQLLNGVHQAHVEGSEDEDEDDEDEDRDKDDAEGDEDELSDRDAEGEEDDDHMEDTLRVEQDRAGDEEEEDEDEDGEGVGAVKIQPAGLDEDEDAASAQDDDEESDDTADDVSKNSSESESEAEVEGEWEAEAAQDDEETERVDPNRCIFCQQDEDHDPSPEFEEYLACAVCGDNAHRQCARDADALESDEDAEKWRCPGCVSNALQPEEAPAVSALRWSSAPKLARDLLPPQRGAVKPDSHSVFNHLIVDDDPMDGSRLLRKRKTSSVEAEDRIMPSISKRRKRNSVGSSDSLIADVEMEDMQEKIELRNEITMETNSVEPVTPRASRSLRPPKPSEQPHATIETNSQAKLIIRLTLNPIDLASTLAQAPKPKKKRSRSTIAARMESVSAPPPAYVPHSYSQPFYSFHDKENDELKSKPYGGILSEAEADTSKTLPQADDRRTFDNARQKAEEEWKIKTLLAQAEAETVKKPRKVSGPASQIECINFGGYEIDTWYAAPYPEEYSRNRVLFICEFCLKYMNSEYVAWRHKMKCSAKHPPGDEIYRDHSVSVFEVDGRKNPVYCQNLCLLAKLFLGSKTLYYDVEPFLFYVMAECDEFGCHFVGYFSKEKRPSSQNNVSCILTLPSHQRKGYGNLLIDFSYLLTRVERKSGSPEKPLSDMGLVSYRNYWRLVLCYQLLPMKNQRQTLSIIDLSECTGMTADDIVSALESLRALVRDPVTGIYALRLDYDFFEEYIKKWEDKKYVKLNPDGLVWTPYIMGRNNQNLMEHGPPMTSIAPRDDEDEEKPTGPAQPILTDSAAQVDGIASVLAAPPEQRATALTYVEALPIDAAITNGSITPALPLNDTTITVTSPSKSLTNGTSNPNPHHAISTQSEPSVPPIPPYRFEIFPPITGSRLKGPRAPMSVPRTKSMSTPRSAPRPSVSRPGASRSRPRTSASGRKTARSRKPTGGTGRGPGRWPKGTKKSDFGNADSGPGLPPKLLKEREERERRDGKGEGTGGMGEEQDAGKVESSEEDGILYETPGMSRRRNGGVGRKGRKVESEEEDLVVGDVEVDAEGEDE